MSLSPFRPLHLSTLSVAPSTCSLSPGCVLNLSPFCTVVSLLHQLHASHIPTLSHLSLSTSFCWFAGLLLLATFLLLLLRPLLATSTYLIVCSLVWDAERFLFLHWDLTHVMKLVWQRRYCFIPGKSGTAVLPVEPM